MPGVPSPTSPSLIEREAGELMPANSPLAPFISVHPEYMHGEPCFVGTRVPVKTLFDHLRFGCPIEEFLEGFPDVSRGQALAVVALVADGFLASLPTVE